VARLRCAEKRAADTAFHQAWSRRSELLACGGTYSRRQRFHSTLHHERSRLWDSAGTGLQNNWPAPSVQRPVAVRETSQVALENRWDCVGASSLEPMPSVDVAPDLRAATIAAMSVRYLFVIAACGGFLLQSAVRRIRVRPPDRHLKRQTGASFVEGAAGSLERSRGQERSVPSRTTYTLLHRECMHQQLLSRPLGHESSQTCQRSVTR
jgi:hypothetical protein